MTLQSTISDVRSLAREKVYNARIAFTSRRDFVAWLRVPKSNNGVHRWSNEDLDPTPPERRNWRWYNYVIFYWALSFGNWTLGSTMIGIGLK
jgi:NCS1 family nucleobase:cation symporter-1